MTSLLPELFNLNMAAVKALNVALVQLLQIKPHVSAGNKHIFTFFTVTCLTNRHDGRSRSRLLQLTRNAWLTVFWYRSVCFVLPCLLLFPYSFRYPRVCSAYRSFSLILPSFLPSPLYILRQRKHFRQNPFAVYCIGTRCAACSAAQSPPAVVSKHTVSLIVS